MHGEKGKSLVLLGSCLLVGRAEVDDVLGGRGRGERVVVVGDEGSASA